VITCWIDVQPHCQVQVLLHLLVAGPRRAFVKSSSILYAGSVEFATLKDPAKLRGPGR